MRLAGQAKAGFYPTPPQITEQILRLLDMQPGTRVLDPCCGEGRVLEAFKKGFDGISTYGLELDSNRYAIAKTLTDQCLNCDSLNEFEGTNGAFDILWENPPYDWDIQDEKALRLEKKFSQQHYRYLAENGLLIYIIPFSVLKSVMHLLCKLSDVRVLAFPEKEYQAFKQIVIIARNAKHLKDTPHYNQNKAMLEKIVMTVPEERAWKYLETTETADFKYTVESCGLELKTFWTKRINPDEAYTLVSRSILHERFRRATTPKELNSIQPLAPLTEGHLAMLIAAGMMDGYIETPEGERLVVKGSVKAKDNEEKVNEDTTVIRKSYEITVKAINLTTREMMVITA